MNEVVEVLQSAKADSNVQTYLQHAFFDSTHTVYIGMLTVALLTLVILLLTPKHFAKIDKF